jgi:hypothetical protein
MSTPQLQQKRVKRLVDVDGVQVPLSRFKKLYQRAKEQGLDFVLIKQGDRAISIPLSRAEEILMKNRSKMTEEPKKEIEIPIESNPNEMPAEIPVEVEKPSEKFRIIPRQLPRFKPLKRLTRKPQIEEIVKPVELQPEIGRPSQTFTIKPRQLPRFKPLQRIKRKPQTEEIVEENKSPFKPEVKEELVEEPETIKMFKKSKYTPIEENEIELPRGAKRIVSPSFSEVVKRRIRSVFEPVFSRTFSDDIDYKIRYKPKFASKKKTIIKPKDEFEYNDDYDYEPSRTQIAVEDFAPREESSIEYNPSVTQESYPVFQYSTFGIPDTFVENYAPEEVIRIKPMTDFEIQAKPKPLIVSKTHLILLDKLLSEVL